MKVTVIFDVESMAELRAVLAHGREETLYDCKVENFYVGDDYKVVHKSEEVGGPGPGVEKSQRTVDGQQVP